MAGCGTGTPLAALGGSHRRRGSTPAALRAACSRKHRRLCSSKLTEPRDAPEHPARGGGRSWVRSAPTHLCRLRVLLMRKVGALAGAGGLEGDVWVLGGPHACVVFVLGEGSPGQAKHVGEKQGGAGRAAQGGVAVQVWTFGWRMHAAWPGPLTCPDQPLPTSHLPRRGGTWPELRWYRRPGSAAPSGHHPHKLQLQLPCPGLRSPARTNRSLRLSSSRPQPQNCVPKPLSRLNWSAVMISRPPKKSCEIKKTSEGSVWRTGGEGAGVRAGGPEGRATGGGRSASRQLDGGAGTRLAPGQPSAPAAAGKEGMAREGCCPTSEPLSLHSPRRCSLGAASAA